MDFQPGVPNDLLVALIVGIWFIISLVITLYVESRESDE